MVVSLISVFLIDVPYACYYALNIIVLYFAGEHIQNNGIYKKLVFRTGLLWLITNLLFFKYINEVIAAFHRWEWQLTAFRPPQIIFPIGISYLSFRLIHYLVEAYRSALPRTTLKTFSLYLLFFPTFLSGPVERFQSFHPQADRPKPLDPANITTGLYRILVGIFRKYIIADTVAAFIMPILNAPAHHPVWVVWVCVYGLIFRIYMDLAGYTDIAIGIAKLFGYTIMENFNRPLLQKNIGLYWRNWHISVYTWIRDYVFFPFFGFRSSQLKIYLGSFLIVFLFMVWHAGTLGYMVAGMYHGIGIVTWQLFRAYTRPRLALHRFLNRPFFDCLFIFMTYNFISFGVLLYTFNKKQIFLIVKSLL